MAALELSDGVLLTVVPIVAYWVFSGLYELLGRSNRLRLHLKAEEDKKNLVSTKAPCSKACSDNRQSRLPSSV